MFQLPLEVKQGIEDYRRSLQDTQAGKVSSSRFKGIRVPWGIYSHRGGEVFMSRIRIPSGVVTPSQLRALAYVSEKYGDAVVHITTRQDIQIHNVKIEDTVKIMDYLKEYNLSSRGGGGNTVRNIIGCTLSGVCRDELFDIRGYTIGLTEHLLRQGTSFSMPRKFKICFSACSKDCAGVLVNDIGFLARCHNGKKGFKVFVGGGMGADSRLGKLLEEFIPEGDLGYCVCAVKDVFYARGDRRNKRHNRLRFLIEDIGLEKFKEIYQKELRNLKEKEHIVLRRIYLPQAEDLSADIPHMENDNYEAFLKYNIRPERQKGYASVVLRFARGNIAAKELGALADLEKDFAGIEFRISPEHNIFICRVKNNDLYKIFLSLEAILDDFLYPGTLLNVVACKGALTCNLGLCNSPGLSEAIENVIKKDFIGKKVFKQLEIKLNGCPNSCGHHPVGKLSFYGMVKRVDNRPVPFYKVLLGGGKQAEETRFAEEAGIIPAKNIPDFLREFLNEAEEKISEEEDIYRFLRNGAGDIVRNLLADYAYVPPYSENRDFYVDWGRTEEFSLAGLGPGECGAGVLDMIEADLREAKIALEEAEKEDYAVDKIKKALFDSCRALLVVKGSDPGQETQAFADFREKFIREEIAPAVYSDIKDVYESITGELNLEQRKEKFVYANRFLQDIDRIYKSMDSSFNFPGEEPAAGKKEVSGPILDLKGTPCPINYVKAKLALENLNSGDVLEILLDDGEPINNVSKSLKDDGHKMLELRQLGDWWKLVVEKQ